jgi:hypothetical protein
MFRVSDKIWKLTQSTLCLSWIVGTTMSGFRIDGKERVFIAIGVELRDIGTLTEFGTMFGLHYFIQDAMLVGLEEMILVMHVLAKAGLTNVLIFPRLRSSFAGCTIIKRALEESAPENALT